MFQNKKAWGSSIIIFLLSVQSFAYWIFYGTGHVAAAGPVEENKLVAVFVEKNIYDSLKNDLQWYTIQYIQSRFPRTKALVFPVDTTSIKSLDIQKILTNLYYGGEKDTPSSLIGTVLIGKIPLPIIKKDQNIIPSIIPYTDLEKPGYVYDPESTYFIPSSSSVDNHQELLHGIINFDTLEGYTNYFTKLKTYIQDPKKFTDKKFRYEDFQKLQETFTDQNLPLYTQGQIHDEDIQYHRYSAGLFDIVQGNNTKDALDTLQNAGGSSVANTASNDYPESFIEGSQAFSNALESWKGNLSQQAQVGKNALAQIGDGQQIPTLLLGQSINQQIKNYQSLFSAEYGNTIATEITPGGRWTNIDIGSHITKTTLSDTIGSKILFETNAILEKALDKKIQEKSFSLNIPIPVVREEYYCDGNDPVWPSGTIFGLTSPIPPSTPFLKNKQEAFYFGKNAWDITNAGQTTRYRGTYGNLTTADSILASTLQNNSSGSSVGVSKGFTAQQVIASKGFNTFKAKNDADIYQYHRDNCAGDVGFENYVKSFWGGHTPVNMDGANGTLKTNDWPFAFNPTYDRGIGGALFDIGGSSLASGGTTAGNALAAGSFGVFLQVAYTKQVGFALLPSFARRNYSWCQPKNPVPVGGYNFFNVIQNTADRDIQVVSPTANGASSDYNSNPVCKERLVYKPISSIIKHTSPTAEELTGMNITTPARPIDPKRYVSFKGLGGQILTLDYPNIYDVEVYKNNNGIMELKKPEEIKNTIINYLENIINNYNNKLINENNNISGYINNNLVAFGLLATKDPKASPIGRQYETLPNNFYTSLLGDTIINQVADILYIKNTPWEKRIIQNTVGDHINYLQNNIDIQPKINSILERQLVVGEKGIGTNTSGYEAAYINSYGHDAINNNSENKNNGTPTIIQQADNKRNSTTLSQNTATQHPVDAQQQFNDSVCGVGGDGTVPILKWPSALSCWWKNLRKTALKDAVKISYKNAQGPVYPLSQFKDVLKESYDDYTNYVENTLQIDSVSQSEIASISIDLPSQKLIRGAQLPLSVSVKNKNNTLVDSLLFPIEIITSTGEFWTPGQAIPRIETTNPQEAFLLDSSSIDRSIDRIRITARGPLLPPGQAGNTIEDSKDIILVDGSLRTTINNQQNNNFALTLSNTGYSTRTAGIPSIRDEILPVLGLRLSDPNGGPITSPATITSDKGLIQPCAIITTKEPTAIGQVTSKQCKLQQLWTLTGGSADIKLLPTMKAGKDTLRVNVPGLPERVIDVTISPSGPYSVQISRDTTLSRDNGMYARFVVQDIRGNTIQTPQTIQYTLIGSLTNNNNQKQGTFTTSSTGNSLPILYDKKGGVSYVYGTIQGIPADAQQPGYLREEIPNLLRPQYKLNIAYLTLDGKDWGNPTNTLIPSMISSSPKLISVTTNTYNPKEQYPLVGVITPEGNVLAGGNIELQTGTINTEARNTNNTSRTNILINKKSIGYITGNPPYTSSQIIIENTDYAMQASWAGGSSTMNAFAIVQKSAGSTEELQETNFSPLRSYAGGLTVGESQKILYNLGKINYGDPFLQHADAANPLVTKQTNITLFQDTDKTIKKVMELDIDNDTRKDMIIVYDDDTIRFLKQYGGTPAYKQLGNLMSVADGVQDMRIGDADGNNLADIFVKTKKNTLRIYKNQGGSFDVNGAPICLDVPSGDSNLSGIWQLFVADMDKDNRADLITNDSRGQVRIFYGGGNNGNAYYISSNPYGCDDQRQQRQKDKVRTVATFGLNLQQNTRIYDDSLVHRKGLTIPTDVTTSDPDNAPVPSNIANAIPDPSNPSSINIQQLISAGMADTIRYTATPYDRLPLYESTTLENIAYIPARYLTGNDIVESYKTFAHGSGDSIIVTVSLRAKQNTNATYIEQLRGPWDIAQETDNSIIGFSRGSLPASSTLDWSIGNGFQFVVDNISLQAGQTVSFSYPITYRPTQTITINVEDANNDGWMDITTSPIDGCMPYSYTYRSEAGQSYTSVQETVEPIASGLQLLQSGIKSTLWDIQNGVQTAQNDPSIMAPGLSDVLEQWDQNGTVLENLLSDNAQVNANFNLDLDKLVGLDTEAVEQGINTILQGACQGFGGGGGGLAVPFNMAFLAPGTFNVFGCKAGEDKGLPTFFFPGTLQTPAGPIPFPYGQKGPGDGFYWVGGGTYPSMIRIYTAPTLTMSVGMAICFGPYSAGINLPSPIKHIAGNCIVIAKKSKSGGGGNGGSGQPVIQNGSNGQGNNSTNTSATNTQQNTCRTPLANPSRPISPIGMAVTTNNINLSSMDPTSIFKNPSGWTPGGAGNIQGQTIAGGTYLGILDVNNVPYATQRGQDSINKEQLKAGKPIKLEIQGGNVKGLIKCVINKWLDNQVRYLVNNLTNMSINIYLPDVSQLLEGFQNVRLDELSTIADNYKKPGGAAGSNSSLPNDKSPAGQVLKNLVTKTQGENKDGLPYSKGDVSDLGSVINNPFDALSSRFEQVPLIRVNTQNVTVQVPFIYNEELTRYTAQLEAFGKDAEKSIKQWERVIADLGGLCPKQETQALKDACNQQLTYYISVKDKISQLQRSVKQNLQTMQAYKRFPQELQSWLTVSQRYMTEVSDTVQGVSTDLTSWLNTNATRFEKYVDTIITMVGAVKSRQAIIDFSVNRKSKCGQCAVDNYDYYSCTLGLLCPTLPILAIPPFKLPNIYVDLSNIRLGMDVLLPKVQFVPKSIPLPALPTLPAPPTANIDFTIGYKVNLPSIPQIPAPPRLPELPSFIPSIELNLPTLPPAPKVPRIAPAITSTLNVTSTIGKILCIVKNGIGLVGEKGVKTRIEQLTQRTRSVEPFDSISITKVQPPLKGFDLRVESYVNFEMNFAGLYNVIDEMTQKINKQTNTVLRDVQAEVNDISAGSQNISQTLQSTVDQGNINIQGSIGTDGINTNTPRQGNGQLLTGTKESNELLEKGTGSAYVPPENVDASVLKKDIYKELAALKQSERGESYHTEIAAIENTLQTDTTVTPNHEDVQRATKALQGMVAKTRASFDTYKSSTQDYDKFLDTINTTALIADNDIEGTISASLYKTTPGVERMMQHTENPLMSYFNLQEKITNGFLNALETQSATELNMGVFTHSKLLNLFRTTKKDIQTTKGIITPTHQSIQDSTPVQPLLQSIIAPTVQAANSSYNTIDTPAPTMTLGAIWRDDHSVYTNQSTIIARKNDGTRFTRFYAFEPIKSYSDFAEKADENGYITLYNSAFYVWNKAQPITNFAADGQSNKTVTVNRKNTGQPVYVLQLNSRIHAEHDNLSYRDAPVKYMLVHASGVDTKEMFVDIANIPNKRLSDLQPDYFMDSIEFDMNSPEVSISIPLDGENWSYISIAQANLTTQGTRSILRTISAWSHQETLGVQRRGDTSAPTAKARIINRDNGTIVAEGTNLRIPRRGSYDMIVQWIDDGVVIKNTIQLQADQDKKNSKEFNGYEGKIENIPTNTDKPLIYYATARDQANNLGNQTINITFEDPTIRIDTVEKQADQSQIKSTISQLFPNGYVRFYNQRDTQPYILTGIGQNLTTTTFATQPQDPTVTGGVFYDADTISLYAPNKDRIAKIDKKTGKITMNPSWQNRVSLRLDTTQNTPIILFVDTQDGKTLFSLYLKSQQLIQATALQNAYTVQTMNAETIGTFAGGQCIKDQWGQCLIYIASDGNIFMPDNIKARIGGTYTYDGGVKYKFTIDGIESATVHFIPQSITQ